MTDKAKQTKPRTRSKVRAPAPAPARSGGGQTLKIPAEDGKSTERMYADLVTRGAALNAVTAMRYTKTEFGDVDLSELVASLKASGEAVNHGDMSEAERLLHSQAVALNAVFAELARRSHLNMGEYLDASERYMRLALKAQSQCRATLETLAAIKNPPIVYARQMNYANGPQQVNNGTPENNGTQQHSASRTPETQTQPNQLLEDSSHGSTQLDTRATSGASRGHPELAPVGAIDRAAH